jgi:predicted Zn-dependent peptidase
MDLTTGRIIPRTNAPRIYDASVAVFERTSLSNGIRVLTAPMPQAQSVSCFVMFAAGSRYESPEIGGIAHFAEHMFFKGTERRPTARDISAEIDGIGGEFNAFTGKEYTGYYVKCAAGTRDVALDVLVDMIRNSRFDSEEIEREKGVIVEEMNMYFDTPRDFVGGVYDELLYGDHPLGRDIIGTKDSVRAATRETFTSFIDRWYRPERMVIGVGGRIGDDLDGRLEELLGSIEARETGLPEPAAALPIGSPVSVFTKQSDQAHIVLGARSYPLGHPDRFALQLLTTVLGGGMSSRLFTEVRERRGLAYYVFSTNASYIDAGSVYAQAGVDIQRIDDAVTTIAAELRRMADEPVPAAELEKARAFAKGRFVLGIESPHGTIMYGLRREVLLGQADEPEAMLAGLDAVTAEDIQRVAQDVVGKQLRLAVIGPFDDAERFERLLEPA